MDTVAGRNEPKRWSRRSVLLAMAGLGLSIPACEMNKLFSWNGGNFVLFGYGTKPNYDCRFKTVRLKIFKNPTFWAVVPVPGLEMELTQALVRAIEQNTPYKIVQGDADTEISGSIRSFTKVALNYNQLNEQRDVETTLVVEVLWKDLRTGEVLSTPAQRAAEPLPPAGLLPGQLDPLNSATGLPGAQVPLITAPISPGNQPATMANTSPTPGNPAPGGTSIPGPPGGPPGVGGPGFGVPPTFGVVVRSVAYYRPEIGQSISTAQQDNVNQMATQIISMMEVPW
jgi:hypothetical protein